MRYALYNRKILGGALSFRLRRDENWAPTSAEEILTVDINGPDYEHYDINIPLLEMGDTFLSFYEDMAEEKGNEILGKDKRGLRAGDIVILRVCAKGASPIFRHILVSSWKHNGAIEDYVTAIMWSKGNVNAFYMLKEGYPNAALKGKIKT